MIHLEAVRKKIAETGLIFCIAAGILLFINLAASIFFIGVAFGTYLIELCVEYVEGKHEETKRNVSGVY